MTTPPNDAQEPDDANRKDPKDQSPQYGRQAPQYGERTPGYGQDRPRYGERVPQPQDGYWMPPADGYGQGRAPFSGVQAKPSAPKEILISFWLLIAAAVVFAIYMLMNLLVLNSDKARSMVESEMKKSAAGGSTLSGAQMDMVFSIVVAVIVIGAVIGIAVYLLVAFMAKNGRNWARVLGTVFAALSLLFLASGFVGVIMVLLGVAAVVLMYLKPSAAYFRASKAPKYTPYG